jgi:hypothetical protein
MAFLFNVCSIAESAQEPFPVQWDGQRTTIGPDLIFIDALPQRKRPPGFPRGGPDSVSRKRDQPWRAL